MNSFLRNKKILITSTDVMMIQFLLPHVQYLHKLGYTVDVACSSAEGYQHEQYGEKIKEVLPEDSEYFHVRTERTPYSVHNILGYKDLKSIINKGRYVFIWTNEPVMGILTRLASICYRKNGGKLMYMVHGYHFFKGAPTKNWIYYPIEKIFSKLCDAITVINWEDYYFTKRHFKTPVYHIDGIGLSLEKYKNVKIDCSKKRQELNVDQGDILIVSVGELQERKNHKVIIEAISAIKNSHIKYIICGRGELLNELKELCKAKNIQKQVQFLGHRYDIPEILSIADIFAHPSQREGLGIAAIEAMAAGLPLITSNVQGIKDYVHYDENGYVYAPNDVKGFSEGISKLIKNPELRRKFGTHNKVCAEKYRIEKSLSAVANIIFKLLNN